MCPIYKFMRSWWKSIKSQFYKLLEHSKCLRFKMKRVCQNETCLGQLWGWASKAYLDKLNRRAASIIEGRSIRAEELKSILGLQAHRNYLKCVLVHKCLHGIAPSYLLSEFRHAHLFHGYNTRSRDFLCPPFAKTAKYQGSFRINGEFKITLKRHFKQ